MNRSKKVNNFIKALSSKGLTLAFAESMTCGLAAHLLSTIKGTSEVLKGSIVCYTPEMKTQVLGVSRRLIEKHTAESRKITGLMAKKLSRLVDAEIHAAITGLASDGASESSEKPVGTVFYAVRYKRELNHKRVVFKGTPLQIREKAVLGLYDFILKVID